MRIALVFLAAFPVLAQDDAAVGRGAVVYAATCSTPYCHGRGGAAGTNAPALVNRKLPLAQIVKATSDGVPGTAMPGWKTSLPDADLRAVIAYVARLSSGESVAVAPPRAPRITRPGDAQRGRDLFFDATRGAKRCSSCHTLDGWGTQVGPDVRGFAGDVKGVVAKNVMTAKTKDGESFPALAVSKGSDVVRVFDLSSPLPVLRSIAPSDVEVTAGGSWTHAAAVANYSDAELAAIAPFLKWVK